MWIFQAMNSVRSSNLGLNYQSGCRDIWIRRLSLRQRLNSYILKNCKKNSKN